ncbi:hypothetical protein bAD24_III04815 [Burkholderia sp. AD24]|nr:hypothetical protein bAD24_III04815 [Burkholderia sp. AD24]
MDKEIDKHVASEVSKNLMDAYLTVETLRG